MPSDAAQSLTEGPLSRTLISFSFPVLISGVLGVLEASVNAMWVGQELGSVALAALANANLLWALLFVGSFGISMAGGVWIGRSLGAGDVPSAKAAFGTTLTVSAALSVICVLSMAVCARALLECLGTPAAALVPATIYLRVLLLSVPLSYLYGSIAAAVMSAGNSKIGVYISAVSIASDAALNPLLIMGGGPVPQLGIAGSALALVASQAIGLFTLSGYLYASGHPLCPGRRDFRLLCLSGATTISLLGMAGPMAIQLLWDSIEKMLMISLVNRFGADATAAYGAVIQLWNFIMMPAAALGVAITSVVAQNIGAARWDRVRQAAGLSLMYAALITAALVALVEVLDRRAFGIFLRSGSPALIYASQINREATWSLIFLGTYVVWVGVLRAMGIVWAPLIISAGVLAVRFPVTAALLGSWQAHAIWWSFPASTAMIIVLASFHGLLRLRAKGILPKGMQPSRSGA